MSRVLVTGATGFVGRHTLGGLAERGYDVHAVTSREPPGNGVTWHRADLLEPAQAARVVADAQPTHLLHLAWYTEPGDYWHSPLNERWVEASVGLLREFAAVGGQRAVVAGTCAEYDWSQPRLAEDETPLRPASVYGAAKWALHEQAGELARDEGLALAWGRLFFLYGPHEHPDRLVPSVARALLRGEAAETTDGAQLRDFMFAPDAADALAALVDSDFAGAVNVASGVAVSVREVVERLGRATGHPELVRLGAIARSGDDPPALVADVSVLRERVGWEPRVGLAEGIERTVAWWRERLAA